MLIFFHDRPERLLQSSVETLYTTNRKRIHRNIRHGTVRHAIRLSCIENVEEMDVNRQRVKRDYTLRVALVVVGYELTIIIKDTI